MRDLIRRFITGYRPTLRKVRVLGAAAFVDGLALGVAGLADVDTFDGHAASFYALVVGSVIAYFTPERQGALRDYLDG